MARPQRKTQAERHAQTHRRIIAATIACIDEQVFYNLNRQNVSFDLQQLKALLLLRFDSARRA